MQTNYSAKQTKTITDKIKSLRTVYESEIATLQKRFQTQISDIDIEIQKIKDKDYVRPYAATFSQSLKSLEKLYSEMERVHRETRGLEFYIDHHIKTLSPRPIPYGKVLKHFTVLTEECCEAVNAVSHSSSVQDDVAPLKRFCQCLVDLRYIDQNSEQLLKESGVLERERSEELAPLQEKKKLLMEEQKLMLRPEKLSCYNKLIALRDEILTDQKKRTQEVLGGGEPGFDGSYRFLVGYYMTTINPDDLQFATTVLGVTKAALAKSPIYFHYTVKHDTLLIKAPSSFLESNQFNDFIRNLYFTFASRLPARNLLFCGIECNTIDAVVGGLGEKIHQLGSAYLCHEVVDRGNDLTASNGVLAKLRGIAGENSKKQKGESINDIFEYNEVFPDNPQKFVFLCVNNYPEGFNSVSSTATQDLRQMLNGGAKGIISVICETTDGRYNDSAPMLTAEELHADCVEFDEAGNMRFNGNPATCDITAPGFLPRDYWFTLDKYFKSSASVSLESLLKAADRVYNRPDPIAIPVGNSDGEVFHLELTECTDRLFGLIIGTVGSGKSAFLHTLILSAAYNNSPEDLQFYLADFKDGSGSTEFSHYRKEEGVNNLYIPHVRYLLLKGKTESAFDLLEKIESIRSKRAELLARAGYSQITDYNASPAVRSGKVSKLPHIFFIIDEYNAMLNGGNGNAGQSANSSEITGAIAAKIKNLISTARAYGIGIILCGQSVDKALKNGQALGNMGCRISLPVKSDSELVSLFDLDSYDARRQMQKLAGKGDALISLGSTSNLRYVRTAYSGKTNGSQQLRIAEAIRQKYAGYEYAQVEAGSEDAVLVTELAENELGYQAREEEFLLEMGISSANALRMPLVFSTAEAAYNYYAYAAREKLCLIERNAMFAFLDRTVTMKREKGFARITYLALKDKMRECLDPYLTALPFLKEHLETVDNKTDIAIKLMALRKLYRERKRAFDKGTSTQFAPLFVVLRDVAWLNDKEAEWLPDFASAPAPAPTAETPAIGGGELNRLAQATAKQGVNISSDAMSMLSSFMGGATAIPAQKPAQTVERFGVADVRNALATLYAHGSRYGIFMLVTSESYKPIVDVLMGETDDRNLALGKYGIFGSFEESKQHTVDLSAPKDCIFINYFNSKTRLYDYSPNKCRAWWQALENRLKG